MIEDVDGCKKKFLEAYEEKQSALHASEAAGISRKTAYNWRDADEKFKEDWDKAKLYGAEELASTLFERAKHGTEKIIYDKDGTVISKTIEYNVTREIFMLKHRSPEIYGDKMTLDVSAEENAKRILDFIDRTEKKYEEEDVSSKDKPDD